MDQKITQQRTTGTARLLEARQHVLGDLVNAPHRSERVAETDGVVYINDSKATFLDATLRSMAEIQAPLVWITGALPDDHGTEGVAAYLLERVKAVVHFGATDGSSSGPFGEDLYQADDLRTAVFVAHELALPGDVVLFSPACPSGNGFANYEERGHAFKQAVRDL
ncbi:MAG: hypothetical protein H6595_04265 [Flavobacteriales bacterium]|nr:hypothetical protein [Flavobacteriales bacterium]MCB9166674.1 hypothetical protein [Flavobacteriales bacterium]